MRLLLIRSAETDPNLALRYGGQALVPLNARGQQQAQALARGLLHESISVLLTSDLVRAAETAAVLASTLKLSPQPLPELRELDLGQGESLTPEQLYRRFPDQVREYARDPQRPVRAGGESYMQLRQRAAVLLDQVVRQGDLTVAAVTHGGLIRAALQEIIGMDLLAFPCLALEPCSVIDLRHSPSGWRWQITTRGGAL